MIDEKSKEVLEFVRHNPSLSSKDIHQGLALDIAYATVKRVLTSLVAANLIVAVGAGRGTKYEIGAAYELNYPLDIDEYFEKEVDERQIKTDFNLELISDTLNKVELFTNDELVQLYKLQKMYKQNISRLSKAEFRLELERLAIDLSWKSSQIEGNTYSLLETEHLLKEKETAGGKSTSEAVMLLNHKEALDFIIEDPTYITPLTISRIEDIHSILSKELGIDRNLRRRRVGISGTNYRPLENEFQIKEALGDMCELVNNRQNIFEKALLILVLISYIQPFNDGNKRTARIVSNAVLMANNYCPISFRTADSMDYKKALLIFYEQNNITAFKRIVIEQFEFAVNTYF